MIKKPYILSILLILFSMVLPVHGLSTNGTVEEQDISTYEMKIDNPILENAIRIKLDKPKGSITKDEILSIKELDLTKKNISHLDGIEELINLEKLYLNHNDLSNIDHLKGLTNLKLLHLQKNNIRDLSPLRGLIKLEEVSLNSNKVSNIEDLKGLINMKKLYLAENDITDISGLRDLTKLRELYLQRNLIREIESLSNLKNLEELSLNGNRVSSIEPLKDLTKLKKLYLIENNLIHIRPLKNLNNLTSLYIQYGNNIREYSPIMEHYEHITMKDFDLEKEHVESVEAMAEKSFLGIEELIEEAKLRSKKELELNGFYAISSYEQLNELKKNNTLNNFDSICFGWAHMNYETKNDQMLVSLKNNASNKFSLPNGYKELLREVKDENIKTYLNIYADAYYAHIFDQSDVIIEQIVELIRGKNKSYSDLSFDGVVIDFEKLPNEYGEEYVVFLKELKEKIDQSNKKLIVALQPMDSYKYGHITSISDKVILMLHDYEAKEREHVAVVQNKVENPITPIEKIKGDLIKILNDIDREEDLSKVWLQINFSVSQWKVSEGKIMNSKPYTPEYKALLKRIEIERKKTNDIIQYDKKYENPYILYKDNHIINTIWYEDSRSVKTKIKLGKDLGLGGISIWRLGNIPNDREETHLDTWKQIIESK